MTEGEDMYMGSSWGGYGDGPGIRRVDIVQLLVGLEPGEPDDLDTWSYSGKRLTEQQQVIVRTAHPTEWSDALVIMQVDVEAMHAELAANRARLERLQRRILRMRARLERPDE